MEAVRQFVPDKGIKQNFFRVHGRISQGRYLRRSFTLLFIMLIAICIFLINRQQGPTGIEIFLCNMIGMYGGISIYTILKLPFTFIAFFGIPLSIISWILLTGRRMEDLGLRNWIGWILSIGIIAITLILLSLSFEGFLYAIVFNVFAGGTIAIVGGTNGPNKYGTDPRDYDEQHEK